MENQILLCDKDLRLIVLLLRTTQNGKIWAIAPSLTRKPTCERRLVDVEVGYKTVPYVGPCIQKIP
jgi:hypothetical protein